MYGRRGENPNGRAAHNLDAFYISLYYTLSHRLGHRLPGVGLSSSLFINQQGGEMRVAALCQNFRCCVFAMYRSSKAPAWSLPEF